MRHVNISILTSNKNCYTISRHELWRIVPKLQISSQTKISVEIKLPPSNYFILDIDINIGNNIEMKNLQNLFSRLPNWTTSHPCPLLRRENSIYLFILFPFHWLTIQWMYKKEVCKRIRSPFNVWRLMQCTCIMSQHVKPPSTFTVTKHKCNFTFQKMNYQITKSSLEKKNWNHDFS